MNDVTRGRAVSLDVPSFDVHDIVVPVVSHDSQTELVAFDLNGNFRSNDLQRDELAVERIENGFEKRLPLRLGEFAVGHDHLVMAAVQFVRQARSRQLCEIYETGVR